MSLYSHFNNKFTDEVAESCLKLYSELPKTGKPIEKEWTVLSCVLQYDNNRKKFDVVSLGTGSKCIGASKMSPSGDVLNDSHAEIIARRGLLLYLYENIELALESKRSIFIFENGKFKLKENLEFFFYSSQLPCGDASIVPRAEEEEDFGDILQTCKHAAQDDICDTECKKRKSDVADDIHRTGAKCLPESEQDPQESGSNYHILNQVRTKPGRGDRTLSVSCSDKLAKWIHVGIQGSLLNLLLSKPIYISHFIFGAGVPYSVEALTRALLIRNCDNLSMIQLDIVPEFHLSTLAFPSIKSEVNTRPAPGSIVWVKSRNKILEVAVQGKKLGVTKKKAKLLSSSVCISKYNIYKRFQSVLRKNTDLKQQIIADNCLDKITYSEMKNKSTCYYKKWNKVKEIFFKCWTKKPEMWNFCIDEI